MLAPRSFCAFLLLGAFIPFLYGQQTVNRATIGGRVTDPSGAVIAGAQVTARQTETGIVHTADTDRRGRFRFPDLRIGPYQITVHKQGFADVSRLLTLTAGAAFEMPISLPIATAATKVTVTEQAPMIETARSQIASTISRTEIKQVPLNGRNFLDLAFLVPGASPANTGSNQLFAETSAVPGQGISIDSQRNFSNSFIVDGLSNNDDAAGITGAFYDLDVVDNFQVVTSGGQAEFGRASGGYVSIVTKSGTNTLHGDLYGYFRNSRFDAANPLLHQVLPQTEAQYGASLGGPIVHNRTFYFANFERREWNRSGLATISPANTAAINSKLSAIGYPGSPVSTGLYPNPVHMTNIFSKVDHQFSERDQFSARYSLYKVNSIHSRGAGGLNAPSASANLYDTDQVIALGNILTLSPHMVNETRGQFWNANLEAPPADPIGPAVSISGVASFGTLSVSPTARRNKLAEAADNLSYRAGAHAIRVGADFLYNGDTITFPRSARGSYSFSSLARFLSGAYTNSGFTQTFANSVVAQANPNIGWYAQDEWTIGSSLTLNLGVRYDLQFLKTIDIDANNISPRAGFAWTPFASRKTVIRGGYGIYYNRIPLRALANALLSANNTTDPADLSQISVSLSPAQAGAPRFPDILPSLTLPPNVLFNFSTMQRNIQNSYSEEGNLAFEQQLGPKTTIEAGYEHVRGLHLIASINQNVPRCVASGSNNGCRPNPAYGDNRQYSSAGDSNFNSLYISLERHPSRWGNYRISYTYSKAMDDVGGFFFSSPINNFNIWEDYGRSDNDQRHRFVFDGTVRFPYGIELTGMLQYYSRVPFNITTGENTIQGTTARPRINGAFIHRNAGAGFDFFNVNARVSRNFHLTERLELQAIAEGFNLTNHVNGVTLNGVFGGGAYPDDPLPTFKQMTAAGDPRAFQFALRLSF
jgi:hypothetical protein